MLLFEDRRSEHSLRSSVNSWFYNSFVSLSLISSPQAHLNNEPEIAVGKIAALSRSFSLKRVASYLLLHRAHDALQHHLNAHPGHIGYRRSHWFRIQRLTRIDDNNLTSGWQDVISAVSLKNPRHTQTPTRLKVSAKLAKRAQHKKAKTHFDLRLLYSFTQ